MISFTMSGAKTLLLPAHRESDQSHDSVEKIRVDRCTSIAFALASPFLILMPDSIRTEATSEGSRSRRKPR